VSYTGQDIAIALKETRRELMNAVERWKQYGHDLALAERDYRIACRAEVFVLHTEEKVPWTTASDISRGDESMVASLRYKRDVARVNYSAEEERINVLKIEARMLEAELRNP
jgi:hypothetical protein